MSSRRGPALLPHRATCAAPDRAAPDRAAGRGVGLAVCAALAACGGEPPEEPPPDPAPSGSAVVRFTLENADGEEVSCARQNLTGFVVALGGQPEQRTCGDRQEVVFADLLPGRYPVLIRLLASGAVIREHLGNVIVEDGQRAEYSHAFSVEGGTFGTGTFEIRWFIDGAAPSRGCPLNDGDRVQIRVSEGPQDDLMLEADCTDGQVTVEDVRQGTYRIDLQLFDSEGDPVGFPAVDRQERVDPAQTTRVALDVVIALPSGGELLALWTVNSSAAPMGCDLLPSNRVEVSVRTDSGAAPVISTATAACAAGGLDFGDLPTGRTREGAGLRVTYRLFDTTIGSRIVDSDVVDDVVLQPGRTSTVTGDLTVPLDGS